MIDPSHGDNTPTGHPMATRRRCKAINRKGERCGQWAMRNLDVCRFHGGLTPAGRATAGRNQVMARAEKAVLALDPDARSGNWIDAMERVLARLEGMEEHLRAELASLDVARIRQHGGEGGETIHALVQAYGQVLDRLGNTAHRMGQLDLESVRIRIADRQADAVTEAVTRALTRTDLTPAQQDDVRTKISQALTQLHEEGRTW